MRGTPDQIIISQLLINTHIGVTDEEQEQAQQLKVSLALEPLRGLSHLEDNIANTVDYFEATRAIKALAAEGKRRLIETLAEEIAALMLRKYPLEAVEVEVRKYILPDTEHVAVRIRRPQ